MILDRRSPTHVSIGRLQVLTKTSLMLGVGETPADVEATLRDLRSIGCDVVTFGQYLRPSKRHMPMREYVTPEAFAEWQRIAEVRCASFNARQVRRIFMVVDVDGSWMPYLALLSHPRGGNAS